MHVILLSCQTGIFLCNCAVNPWEGDLQGYQNSTFNSFRHPATHRTLQRLKFKVAKFKTLNFSFQNLKSASKCFFLVVYFSLKIFILFS